MQEVEVEVAVAFDDHTWASVWITLEEDEDDFLLDIDATELAEERVLAPGGAAEQLRGEREVSFVRTLHISFPEGQEDYYCRPDPEK